MLKFMLIAGAGGFLGTCGRFLMGRLAHLVFPGVFPYGTLIVNLVGCFLIGLFFGLVEKTQLISSSMNVFLITGFCGGFTTFSSFSDDMYLMMQQKHWSLFVFYLTCSIVMGILLVWAGRCLVKTI